MESFRFKKHILDRFQEHLQQDYEDYCRRHGIDSSAGFGLLTFLIDQELIPPVQIQRYTVRREFRQAYPEQDFHKTQTVHRLADRFQISERTVWSILRGVAEEKI
ncbi:MAG: hypothetical protein R3D58_04780 [Saprospiraceae bacterium]|nr:hypothetical protein [Lewinellaceae bacterium]